MKQPTLRTILATAVIAAVSAVFIYPFAWMFLAGFKTNREIFKPGTLLPESLDTSYYQQLFSGQWLPFFQVFGNSLAISLLQALGAVALSALAGFVFARYRFKGRQILFAIAIAVIVLPRQSMAVPLFTWINSLGLADSLLGVILPGLISGLGVLYFYQAFRQIPQAYLDVARLSGATELRVFFTLLPLLKSALLSFGLIHFILAWHEHLIPLLILSSEEKRTLPLALSSLYESSLNSPYAVLMAASTLILLPTVILFALLYKRFKTSMSEILQS